jgi:hypothetical protein
MVITVTHVRSRYDSDQLKPAPLLYPRNLSRDDGVIPPTPYADWCVHEFTHAPSERLPGRSKARLTRRAIFDPTWLKH